MLILFSVSLFGLKQELFNIESPRNRLAADKAVVLLLLRPINVWVSLKAGEILWAREFLARRRHGLGRKMFLIYHKQPLQSYQSRL